MKLGAFAKRHARLIKRKSAERRADVFIEALNKTKPKPKPSKAPPKPSQALNAWLGPPFVNRHTAMHPRDLTTLNYVPEVPGGPEKPRKRPPATTRVRLPKKPRKKKQ